MYMYCCFNTFKHLISCFNFFSFEHLMLRLDGRVINFIYSFKSFDFSFTVRKTLIVRFAGHSAELFAHSKISKISFSETPKTSYFLILFSSPSIIFLYISISRARACLISTSLSYSDLNLFMSFCRIKTSLSLDFIYKEKLDYFFNINNQSYLGLKG